MYARVNALKSFFVWLNRQGYTEEHRLAALKLAEPSMWISREQSLTRHLY